MVYELNTGQVFILAYILHPNQPLDMVVSTDAGAAMDVNGNPSQSASFFLRYTPRPASVDRGGLAMNAVLASTLAASAAMSTLTGLNHPYMPAGGSQFLCLQSFPNSPPPPPPPPGGFQSPLQAIPFACPCRPCVAFGCNHVHDHAPRVLLWSRQ